MVSISMFLLGHDESEITGRGLIAFVISSNRFKSHFVTLYIISFRAEF